MENNTAAVQKATSSSSSVALLPVDITETILLRLPVKSLLRFKTVCKSWQTIISNPRFSRTHHRQQMIQKSQNLFLTWEYDCKWEPFYRLSLIKYENRKFRTESVLELPLPAVTLCSCNCMLLLNLRYFPHNYFLWNPSIRTYTGIMFPPSPQDSMRKYGLYHDSRTDDYKVVIISQAHYTVYSCKKTSWTEIKSLPSSETGLYRFGGIFVDGAFYWLTEQLEPSLKRELESKIVCFDVRDEKFKKVPLPNDLISANDGVLELKLIRLSGRLCLDRRCRNGTKTKIQVWVMEKQEDENYSSYTWRELMNMEKEEEKPHLTIGRLICLTNEDNVVIRFPDFKCFEYDRREKSFKELEVCWNFLRDMFPYSDSLYFPIQNIMNVDEEAGG